MLRVADVVMRFLAERGVRDVFTVSGGGIMHLVDALGSAPGLRYRVNNHEQASAIAAEAYARVTGGLGACLVTTGPGSTNALSALAGAYVDSVPVLCIAGQVRREVMADYARQRQYGPQEIDIAPMVAPVTKYQTTLMDPARVLIELETAYELATTGRPGPVWITIPLDVQAALVDEEALAHAALVSPAPAAPQPRALDEALVMLRAAERPLLIGGAGVRLAGAQDAFRALARATGIPVLLTIGAMDLLPETHPQYLGKFGPVGQRRANFALQNADVLLSVGASMSISSIGFNTEAFAPHARRIMVNVDRGELDKVNYRPDLAIEADAGAFLRALLPRVAREPVAPSPRWLEACARWKERYPIVGAEQRVDPAFVCTYAFVDALSEALGPDDVVVTGNSLDAASVYQAFRVRDGQRVFTNVNFGAMGWDLPAAIGAAAARPHARTVLVTGDGSIQFNVQELMTAAVNRCELKIFVGEQRRLRVDPRDPGQSFRRTPRRLGLRERDRQPRFRAAGARLRPRLRARRARRGRSRGDRRVARAAGSGAGRAHRLAGAGPHPEGQLVSPSRRLARIETAPRHVPLAAGGGDRREHVALRVARRGR